MNNTKLEFNNISKEQQKFNEFLEIMQEILLENQDKFNLEKITEDFPIAS